MKKQALYMAPAIEEAYMVEEETLLSGSGEVLTEVEGDAGLLPEVGIDESVEGLDGQARTLLNNLLFH